MEQVTTPTVTPTATPTPTATDQTTDLETGALDEVNDLLGADDGDDAGDDTSDATDKTATEATDETVEQTDEATGDETDAADAEETADDVEGEEKDKKKPAAAPAPEKKEPDPKEVERQQQAAQQHQQRVTDFRTSYQKLKSVVDKKEYEPYEHGAEATSLLLEGLALIDHELGTVRQFAQQQQETRKTEDFWDGWGRENAEIGAKVGREIFTEEFQKAAAEFPDASEESLQIAATREFNRRLRVRKGQLAAKGNAPARSATGGTPNAPARTVRKPPVTKGGSTVMPPPSASRVPNAVPKSIDDKLDAGIYGDLSSIV